MNSKRIISAIFGIPLVIIILILGGMNKYIIDIAFAIISAISLHEYFNSFKEKAKPVIWIGYLTTFMIAIMQIIPEIDLLQQMSIVIIVVMFLLFLQVIFSKMKTNTADVSITLFGICYIPIFIMFIPLIREMPYGEFLIWYVFASAWGTDSLAYFVGKNIGKHKFSTVSPNKSIEGCIAGIFGSIILVGIMTFIFNTFFDLNISYLITSILAIILSIVSQIGDFAASSIKRYVGIKDFSNLIPGHGGMLDRFDSIIFVAPIAYFLLQLFL